MGFANVRDQTARRFSRLHQRLDVAGVAGPHLNDGNLVLLRQAEQCLRHAHVVIEVALRGQNVVFLGQHGTDEFLRCRLAVGARDAYHRNLELAAMLACQHLQYLQHVGYQQQPPLHHQLRMVDGQLLVVYHGQPAALLQSLHGKLVAVEVAALQGEEDAALGAVATVGRYHRMLCVQRI